jgi:hypothetical protein
MHHLGTCIGLLHIIGHCHGIEFTDGIMSFENAAWIFPGNG